MRAARPRYHVLSASVYWRWRFNQRWPCLRLHCRSPGPAQNRWSLRSDHLPGLDRAAARQAALHTHIAPRDAAYWKQLVFTLLSEGATTTRWINFISWLTASSMDFASTTSARISTRRRNLLPEPQSLTIAAKTGAGQKPLGGASSALSTPRPSPSVSRTAPPRRAAKRFGRQTVKVEVLTRQKNRR